MKFPLAHSSARGLLAGGLLFQQQLPGRDVASAAVMSLMEAAGPVGPRAAAVSHVD